MSIEDNKAVARAFIERVFEANDPTAMDDLATDDFTPHTYGPMPPGREPMRHAQARVHAALSEVEFRIDDVIAEGDEVAVRLTASGTQTGSFMGMPPSGRRYTIPEIHIFRIRDGKVSEHWHAFDSAALIAQLKP
jgi:steroid delta-isomerase-like uncharacterized protein